MHETDQHQTLVVAPKVNIPYQGPHCSTSPSNKLCGSSTASQFVTKPIFFACQVRCSLQELSVAPTMCKVELTHVTFST